jgi:hypothetical protein
LVIGGESDIGESVLQVTLHLTKLLGCHPQVRKERDAT